MTVRDLGFLKDVNLLQIPQRLLNFAGPQMCENRVAVASLRIECDEASNQFHAREELCILAIGFAHKKWHHAVDNPQGRLGGFDELPGQHQRLFHGVATLK
jgi:hypothetical protein